MRGIALVTVLVSSAAALAACSGSSRSVEAFCSTMYEHKDRYLEQMGVAQAGGVGGLITAISAVGDLKIMWKELADVAPDDIQADVESVSEAWQQQEDNAGSMDWMAILSTGLLNSGSMSRVDTYVRENCDGDFSVADASVEEEVSEEVEPEPTPEPVPAILEDAWTNEDGYSYTFTLDSAVGTAMKDIANAKPGEANISWNYSFTGTFQNTTPERNAPGAIVKVTPAWAAGSLVCSVSSMVISHAWSSNTDGRDEAFCSLAPFPFTLGSDADIPMGGTIFDETSGGGMVQFAVPEASADAIIAELQSPTLWAIGRNINDGAAQLLTDCLMETGAWYMSKSTMDTGCQP